MKMIPFRMLDKDGLTPVTVIVTIHVESDSEDEQIASEVATFEQSLAAQIEDALKQAILLKNNGKDKDEDHAN